MKIFIKTLSMTLALTGLILIGSAPNSLTGITLVPDAEALVGRPATPVSYAGVARRTTRRAVAVTSSSAAASSAAATSNAQQQVEAPPPAPSSGLPVGSTVQALPGGCTPFTKDNVQYNMCNNTYYRTAFQGTNLVYVVVDRP